jgi:hypothetical protein
VEVPAGQSIRVDLELAAGVAVRGRVTHEGKPMAGVRVVFAVESGLSGSATSRADGGYEVELPAAGTYQIFAHANTVSTGNAQLVREVRGGDTIDIELREQVVEGSVVDAATRQPLEGVTVTLVPVGSPMQSFTGETFTDANGRFRMLTASSGAYRLIAWGPGYAHNAQDVQLGSGRAADVAFEMSRSGELRVRVIDAKSGVPLNVYLTVQTAEGMFLPLRAEQSGDQASYIFSIAAGKYRITAMAPGYAERTVEATAPGTVDIALQ